MNKKSTQKKRPVVARKVEPVVRHETSFIGGVLRCSCGWAHREFIPFGAFAQVERLADAHKANPVVRGATESRTSPPRCSTKG